MSHWSPIELTRDCTASTVPHGVQVALTAGGLVEIVQRLGASITARTEMGSLLRIDCDDADALGLEPLDDISASIVELGLVYCCEEMQCPDGTSRIEIDMWWTDSM